MYFHKNKFFDFKRYFKPRIYSWCYQYESRSTRFSTLDGTPKNAIFQLGSFHRHLFVNLLRPTDYLFHLKTFQTKKTFSQKQKLLEAHLKFNFNTQLAKLLKNSSILTRLALNVARWLLISRTASGTEMLFWTTTVDGLTLLTAIFDLNRSLCY